MTSKQASYLTAISVFAALVVGGIVMASLASRLLFIYDITHTSSRWILTGFVVVYAIFVLRLFFQSLNEIRHSEEP